MTQFGETEESRKGIGYAWKTKTKRKLFGSSLVKKSQGLDRFPHHCFVGVKVRIQKRPSRLLFSQRRKTPSHTNST